ncbi:MAG: short-chain dehydrogenase [Nocardioides sp.]|jgi:retinol dehydrogenase-14|uniref:hypothetical protein n=1 Tax=Nocardioides sp. TaxID=35761 RepID=UPI0026048613|nr:hypothetical protein [Nocardioides sp.]MCW2832955.1 short-chain dehydrogenase [Nocardioides sp.]
MPSPSRGADTSVLLASDPSLDGVTGRYFARGKLKKSSPRSYDQSVARRLWQTGEQLLKSGPVGR